jgi:iron(III) transport system permease protein
MRQPSSLVWIALAAILTVLIVLPMGSLISSSLQDGATGAFTFNNYLTAYGKTRHITALLNTLKMGAATVALGLIYAVPLAWACARTDMPGRGLVRIAVLGAFITPPYLSAIGWILLAGPNAGWINKGWTALTGDPTRLVNIFSFEGLVFVMASNVFFLIFVFTYSAFELVSSEMEDSANILGAGPMQTAAKVTFPLILPAILGGAIITFLLSIALYGVPSLISIPARYPVAVIQLTEFFSNTPIQVEVAAAYSIPLLAITAALLGLQRLILRRRNYTAVTGKGAERRIVKLGPWRWVMLGYAVIVMSLTLLLPVSILFLAAFAKAWGRGFAFDNFTFDNFDQILFHHSTAQQAIATSIGLGAVSASIAIVLALGIAYIVQRRLLPASGALAFLCMAPFVVPGIVLAIGFFAAYAPPPLSLYGTYTILALAFITRFLPVAFTASSAGIRAISPEMEEAVRSLGGGRLIAIQKVVAPLLKRTLAGGWLLIFVPAAQELSTAIFLVGPKTRVVSVLVLDMSEEGRYEHLAALGCILLVILAGVVALGFKIMGRDFMLRRETA